MNIEDICINERHKLIITIVKKGMSKKVIKATKEKGVEGATVFLGQGSVTKKSYLRFIGLDFEPEKDIIFTYVNESIAEAVLDNIRIVANLDKPDSGISFILDVKYLAGICHLLGV